MPGKHEGPNEARDEALHLLCGWEWGNQSGGNVEAPTGYFWLITITEREIPEIVDVFRSCTDEHQILDTLLDPELLRSLVGTFVLQEDSNGFVHVRQMTQHADPQKTPEARGLVLFRTLEQEYDTWAGAGE